MKNEQVLIGLQNRISDLQRELGNERLVREKVKQDLQTKIQGKDEHLNVIQQQYGNEILACLQEISCLENEREQLNDIIALLQGIAESELGERNQTITNLNNRVNQLTNQINGLNNQVTNLKNNLTNENNAKTRAESEVNRLDKEIDNLRSQLNSAQSNYDYYYSRYCDKDREVENLRNKLSSEENSNSYLRNEISGVNYEKRKLETEIHNLKVNLEVASKNLDVLKKVIKDFPRISEDSKTTILALYVAES